MSADIIAIIEKYYPKNISAFELAYDTSDEQVALKELKSKFDERWPVFVDRMVLKFRHEYVDDRTDCEPGNRCIIYCYRNNFLFEIVVHISRMVEYFFFWVKKHSVNTRLVQMRWIGIQTNHPFPEVENEVHYILQAIKEIYNYTLMTEELAYTPIPYISTQNRQLGEARILDLVFADTDLSS